MEIRRIAAEEIPELLALRFEALSSQPEAFAASIEEESARSVADWQSTLTSPGGSSFILGAFIDTSLVGMIGFYRQGRLKLRHKGAIWGVYVRPDFRGRGIGKELVGSALTRAREISGLSIIQLSVSQTSRDAASLYKKLGFVEYGVEPFAMKIGDKILSETHMWISLEDPSQHEREQG